MPQLKFDRVELDRLLRAGKKKSEIAKIFGVSPGAITHALKELRPGICTAVALEAGHKILNRELDVVQQLYESNKRINEVAEDLMNKLKGKDTGTLDVQGNKDIRLIIKEFEEERRKQLAFQVEIFKTLSDYKVIADFQKTVIDIVGNADKCPNCGVPIRCQKCGQSVNLRERIVSKFKEARALAASIQVRP